MSKIGFFFKTLPSRWKLELEICCYGISNSKKLLSPRETQFSSWSVSTNLNHFFIKTHHRKFLNIFGQVHVILSGYSHGVRINGCTICQWTGGRVRASVNIYRAGTSSYRTPLYDRVYILFRVCKKWSAYALKKWYKRKKKT